MYKIYNARSSRANNISKFIRDNSRGSHRQRSNPSRERPDSVRQLSDYRLKKCDFRRRRLKSAKPMNHAAIQQMCSNLMMDKKQSEACVKDPIPREYQVNTPSYQPNVFAQEQIIAASE